MNELKNYSKIALGLIDLTSLNEDDTDEVIIALCQKAKTEAGTTAAVCVYPRFIELARRTLNELGLASVKVATVTNFPHGNPDIAVAVDETLAAVAAGADEVKEHIHTGQNHSGSDMGRIYYRVDRADSNRLFVVVHHKQDDKEQQRFFERLVKQ